MSKQGQLDLLKLLDMGSGTSPRTETGNGSYALAPATRNSTTGYITGSITGYGTGPT